jgi:hypothetical protein
MKFRHLLLALIVLFFCDRAAVAGDIQKEGRAKFEIFGMKDEYLMLYDAMLHDFDARTIERFYPSESVVAAHFDKLLPVYCAEEGIAPEFVKKVDADGFISFISPTIANNIRSHYAKGALKESELDGASPHDLLRYLLGAYIRYNYKQAAIISAANSPYKAHNLAVILSNLGCSDVKLYTYNAVPVSYLVIFSPTEDLRQKLGIHKEISFATLNKAFGDDLKLHEK